MKRKILQIVFLVALGFIAKADHFTSAINISNQDNDLITVVFDGMEYPNAVNQFHLAGITPGKHFIKVFTREYYGWNYSHFAHQVYSGGLFLKPGEEIFAVIGAYNQLRITKVMNCAQQPISVVKPIAHCNTSYNYQTDYSYNYNDDHCNQPTNYGPYAMDEGMFCALKQSIADKWFDSSKLEVVQMAMKNNFFTTAQVSSIMNLFDFESTKLDFAKQAYSHTVDPQNYWLVNNAFTFSSSISELQHFLGI